MTATDSVSPVMPAAPRQTPTSPAALAPATPAQGPATPAVSAPATPAGVALNLTGSSPSVALNLIGNTPEFLASPVYQYGKLVAGQPAAAQVARIGSCRPPVQGPAAAGISGALRAKQQVPLVDNVTAPGPPVTVATAEIPNLPTSTDSDPGLLFNSNSHPSVFNPSSGYPVNPNLVNPSLVNPNLVSPTLVHPTDNLPHNNLQNDNLNLPNDHLRTPLKESPNSNSGGRTHGSAGAYAPYSFYPMESPDGDMSTLNLGNPPKTPGLLCRTPGRALMFGPGTENALGSSSASLRKDSAVSSYCLGKTPNGSPATQTPGGSPLTPNSDVLTPEQGPAHHRNNIYGSLTPYNGHNLNYNYQNQDGVGGLARARTNSEINLLNSYFGPGHGTPQRGPQGRDQAVNANNGSGNSNSNLPSCEEEEGPATGGYPPTAGYTAAYSGGLLATSLTSEILSKKRKAAMEQAMLRQKIEEESFKRQQEELEEYRARREAGLTSYTPTNLNQGRQQHEEDHVSFSPEYQPIA